MASLVVSVIGFVAMDLIMVMPRMPDGGETMAAKSYAESPGGKGNNSAVAAFRTSHLKKVKEEDGTVEFDSGYDNVSIEVRMIGAVGVDKYGDDLVSNLKTNGVNTDGITPVSDLPTGICLVIVEARTGESRVLTTPGATAILTPANFPTPESLGNGIVPGLIISQLELSRETVEHVLRLAHNSRVDVLLNAAPAQQILTELYKCITHLVVNETEAAILSGREVHEVDDEQAWEEIASEFLDLGTKNVVITLGARGAYYANATSKGHVLAEVVKVKDATGAGDTFVGTYATDYLRQKGLGLWNIEEAVGRANRASAYTITKVGAQGAIPWANEIDELDMQASVASLPQGNVDAPADDKTEMTHR